MFGKSKKAIQAPLNKSFYALGTIDSLVAYGSNSEEALHSAMERVYDIDYRMSVFRGDSEISLINRAAGVNAVPVGSDTYFVIKKALQFAEITGGCNDITVAPVLDLWRAAQESGAPPDNRELGKRLRLVNYRDVVLGSSRFTVRLNYAGQALDLGSIAKGFAADEVRKILRRYKTRSALIDLGGNIVALGLRPDGRPWKIGIQDPDRPRGTFIGAIHVENQSVVTSGCFARGEGSVDCPYHPVIDTKTGYPAQTGLRSVTVICENSIDADALSTAAFAMGLDAGKKLIESFDGAQAVMITDDGKICITDGLKSDFELLDPAFNLSVRK